MSLQICSIDDLYMPTETTNTRKDIFNGNPAIICDYAIFQKTACIYATV